MNKDKRNNIQLLGTLNNADESGIIANANQIYDANEDKSTQDVSKEHTERIETLETKESSMQTTLENITKTGEASAASNVTYNHNDSQLDATNVQQAIDEVHKRSNYNDGNTIIDFNTIHLITDNPEYICVAVDADEKILYGIKTDGQPYFGVGCPQQVKDYVDKQINKILGTDDITTTIDSLKEIESFLRDFTNSDTLKTLLDTKANKTDVDNVIANINTNIADKYKKSNPNDEDGNVVDTNDIYSIKNNPEYIKVFIDSVGKLIEAIGLDGVRKFFAGIDIQGVSQCVTNNPDYLVAWIDKENKIIFAIQPDGNPYFGYGVPKQIKNAIDKLNIDVVNKYTEIKQSISDTNEHLSKTATDIDKKINLGNDVYPSAVHEVSEFEDNISVLLDNLNHILESVSSDGIRNFFAGINVKGNKFTTTDNPEYKAVLLDKDNKVLIGIRNNGDFYFAAGVPKQVTDAISQVVKDIEQLQDKVNLGLDTYPKDVNTIVDNSEYIKALVDADNKILEEIEPDGTHKFNNIISLKGVKADAIDNKEYSQILCDKNNKIIDSIDNKGVVTHNSKHIFKNGIEDTTGKINEDAYEYVINKSSNLARVLREKGDMVSSTDWSDKESLEIPEPRCAYINITSSDGTAATWPTTKTANKKYWMQFWDMQGNYFKKRIILNAQGNSSMGMPKKNGAIDLCNDEWIGDDTFSIKFGDWVSQDSFHVKGYYADYFIGIGAVGYSLFKDIINTRGIYNNRDWKRYLLPSLEAIGTNSQATADLNDNITISNDATCFPQGFPAIVFLDGKFYGIYSWQIKKHRNNYQMKKDNYSEIHLDGMISYDTLFNLNGNLDWDIITGKKAAPSGGNEGFEIRNPKKLICIDGKKYDADTHNVEIIGEDSEKYDSTNADMVNTAKVKTSIINLSKYIPTLQSMVNGGSSNEDIRAKIEEYFDTISIIDYCIFGDLTYNADGYRKNWQWITYNGSKWLVEPYDLDSIFGWNTWGSPSPSEGQLGTNMTIPTGWVLKYYSNELQARYKELRDKKIIDADYILKKLQDNWIERIGSENYKEDHNKWPYNKATYSYAATEYTRKDSIYRVYNWITQRITKCDTLYDYNV